MAMPVLPSFFTMQVGPRSPFLAIAESPSTGSRVSNQLQFDEMKFSSPLAKFAVEQSASGDRKLVHIRSCHNNKYWAAHEVDGQVVFSASMDNPVEDTKDPACTLFRPEGRLVFDEDWLCSFWCISRNMYLRESRDTLTVAPNNSPREFWLVDWESLVLLPSQVSFKSEELKDRHLVSRVFDKNKNYLRFESGRDMGDLLVAHELSTTLDGYYQIKNMQVGRLWNDTGSKRDVSGWILASAADTARYDGSKFLFVKLSDDVLAIRSYSYKRFCGPRSAEGKKDCLSAHYPTLTRQARLIVQERVLERTISDIKYRFEDSRIYQVEFVEITHALATNNTNSVNEMTLKFSIEESRTTSWKNSISVKLGVKAQLRVTIIPVILKGKVEASAQVGYTHEWGEVTTTTTKRELTYKVTVPPFSRRKVTLVCTKAACDVPYSYTQTDLLPNGRRNSIIKDDGVFFGVNSFNFDVEATDVTEDALGRMYL